MFVGKMKMYEYAEPNEILHSKLLLIDDEFTFIGGVNLNQRSFAHDMENGLLIGSQVFNQAVTLLYNSYLPQCKEITQEKKIKFIQ
jgi:phosphatidylserine/phosphatidylglycerophosphate/cardiolipin synthase-like enzyme